MKQTQKQKRRDGIKKNIKRKERELEREKRENVHPSKLRGINTVN